MLVVFPFLINMDQLHFKILLIFLLDRFQNHSGKECLNRRNYHESTGDQGWKFWDQSGTCIFDQDGCKKNE